jgi:hypothetical protein
MSKRKETHAMRVFALTTGRTGSRTFARAMSHQSVFSVAHDSKLSVFDGSRLDLPDWHIEINTRLAWFLGSLDRIYCDDPVFVHLRRNEDEVIRSFFERDKPPSSIMHAFANGIVANSDRKTTEQWMQASTLMVRTVDDNIESFLKSKSKKVEIRLENPYPGLVQLWSLLGLTEKREGGLEQAFEEYSQKSL